MTEWYFPKSLQIGKPVNRNNVYFHLFILVTDEFSQLANKIKPKNKLTLIGLQWIGGFNFI